MSPSPPEQHKAFASEKGPVSLALVTVSDSRQPDTDDNRFYMETQVSQAGHQLVGYHLIKDEPDQVIKVLDLLAVGEAQIIIFNGGTGISRRDTTYDALSSKLEKTLPGFGELFRKLSYEEIGSAAMMSRATAGVYRNKIIISTPGSPAALRLAWEKLIEPELTHLAWEVVR